MTARVLVTVAFACTLIGCGSDYQADKARKVADGFWAANLGGDVAEAEAYVLEGSSATLTRPEDGSPPFEDYTLGKVAVDGNRATVETRIVGANGNPGVELEFPTSLVLSQSMWWIDLDRTAGAIMQVMLGVNMADFGEAMEQAMGQAMQGVADQMEATMGQMAQQMDRAMRQTGPVR